MGRLPHIADVDIPRTVLELADLPDVHPAPIVSNLYFVVRAYSDWSSRLPQQHPFSRSDDPFANPLPILGPHAHVDDVSPVIDDLNGATRLVVVPRQLGLPILHLSDCQERGEHQY